MELLQLRYFIELAKHQHLTKVAERMYVSPSAISSSIARLEEELGVQLFDRTGRNIRLNHYGEEYLLHVEKALAELNFGKQKLRDMMSSINDSLYIATTNPYVWQNSIHSFSIKHPEVTFKTIPLETMGDVTTDVSAKIDLIIASPEGFSNPAWDYRVIFHDRVAVAVPPGHHLANRRTLCLKDIKDEWFVNLAETPFSRFTYNLCLSAGFTPKSHVSCDYTLRPRIAKNENLAILTTFHCKALDIFNDMIFIPLTDEAAFRNQAVFWPKYRYRSKIAQSFIDFMVNLYKDYRPE